MADFPKTTGRPNFRPPKNAGGRMFKPVDYSKRSEQNVYPDNWNELSLEVRKRDGFKCMSHKLTGSGRRCDAYFPPPFSHLLAAHHIVPLDISGTKKSNARLNKKSNLITLCHTCHSKAHGRKIGKDATAKQKAAARKW